MYKLCTEKGYTSKIRIYCGTDALEDKKFASQEVLMEIMDGMLVCGQTLITDKYYYTSISLATQFLQRQTHLIGILRTKTQISSKRSDF